MRKLLLLATLLPIVAVPARGAGGPVQRRLAQVDSLLGRREAGRCLAILDSLESAVRRRGTSEERLAVLLAQAHVYGFLGRPRPAGTRARVALDMAAARDDTLSICEALRWLALSAEQEGRSEEARGHAARMLDLARAVGDADHEAYGRLFLAYGHLLAGRSDAAASEYERSLRLFEKTGNGNFERIARTGLGRVLQSRGDLAGARSCFRRVLEDSRRSGDTYSEAHALNNLGGLEFTLGDPSRAEDLYRDAYELQMRLGNLEGSIAPATNLAMTQTYLNACQEAMQVLTRALQTCREQGYREPQAMVLEQMGLACRGAGRMDEAAACLRQGAQLAEGVSTERLGRILIALAEIVAQRDSLEAGIAIFRERFDRIAPSLSKEALFKAEQTRGKLLFHAGRVEEAAPHFRRADRIGTSLGLAFRVSALTYSARCCRRLGSPDSARAYLGRALAAWEACRSRVADPEWREELEMDGRLLHSELVRELLSTDAGGPVEERVRTAFEVLQRFKARTLVERMRGGAAPDTERTDGATGLSLSSLQQGALREGELLVDFFVGMEDLYLFAVTRDECRCLPLEGSADQLQAQAERYRSLVARPPQGRSSEARRKLVGQASEHLSALLFTGIADLLRSHSKVILAPDGFFNLVPLEALPLPADSGAAPQADPMFENKEVWRVPSASVLSRLRSLPARTAPSVAPVRILAVLGGGDSTSAPLPGARAEIAWLEDSFQHVQIRREGREPEDSAWIGGLDEFDVLHFASHVRIDDDRPWRSGLEQLRAGRICGMRLSARLAVLAGCESAGGRVLSGEGVIGLTAAFTAARVPSVVATLWPVSDRQTARLMEAFYAFLGRGDSVGRALNRAQGRLRARAATGDPFYWAPYVLVGEAETTVPLARRRVHRTLPLVAAAAFLSVAAVAAARGMRKRRGRRSV